MNHYIKFLFTKLADLFFPVISPSHQFLLAVLQLKKEHSPDRDFVWNNAFSQKMGFCILVKVISEI